MRNRVLLKLEKKLLRTIRFAIFVNHIFACIKEIDTKSNIFLLLNL